MGRAKTFTDKKALEKAMYLFWQQGYEQTSVNDLLIEMELLNGSFYHSFGSKKKLFLMALDAYDEEFSLQRRTLFESSNTFPRKIRTLFYYVLERQDSPCPRGCFLFNSVSSDILAHIEFKDRIASMVSSFEDFLCQHIEMAIIKAEISPLFPSKETASILISYIQGLMKRCTLEYDRLHYKKQVEIILESLGL